GAGPRVTGLRAMTLSRAEDGLVVDAVACVPLDSSIRFSYETVRRVTPCPEPALRIELRWTGVARHVVEKCQFARRDPVVRERHTQRRGLAGEIVLLVMPRDVEDALSRSGVVGSGQGGESGDQRSFEEADDTVAT